MNSMTTTGILSLLVLGATACGAAADGQTAVPPPAATTVAAAGAASAAPDAATTTAPAAPAGSTAPTAAPAAATTAPAGAAAPSGARWNISGVVNATPSRNAAYAVVYLEDAPKEAERGMSATVDQKAMTFLPSTAIVTVGGTVKFVNSDPFPHNIFTMDGEKFNLGMLPTHASGKHTFSTLGDYTLLCNVHPGMVGHVLVVPSSYFALADDKGRFTIKGVPEGTFKASAWAYKMALDTQPVSVKAADATVNFSLHR